MRGALVFLNSDCEPSDEDWLWELIKTARSSARAGFGRDYVAVWDSTMARFWFPGGDSVRESIRGWLAQRDEGRIVTERELDRWGCRFPDHRHGELFYLLDNGCIFATSFMNRSRVPGMHGFDPAEPDSKACWLTSHPISPAPHRINEIFHVMPAAAARISSTSAEPALAA